MALTRDTLAERKLKILLRAQFSVKQAFEREEWKEKEFYPLLEKYKADGGVLGLEPGQLFEMVVDEAAENPDPPVAAAAEARHPARAGQGAPQRKAKARARLRHRK